MLVLDKERALDRMVWLSQRQTNAVPSEYLLSAPLRWTATPGGRRVLAGEVVLRPSVLDPVAELHAGETAIVRIAR